MTDNQKKSFEKLEDELNEISEIKYVPVRYEPIVEKRLTCRNKMIRLKMKTKAKQKKNPKKWKEKKGQEHI